MVILANRNPDWSKEWKEGMREGRRELMVSWKVLRLVLAALK
jgi:hypothetical protein